jgi:hypothetical protein
MAWCLRSMAKRQNRVSTYIAFNHGLRLPHQGHCIPGHLVRTWVGAETCPSADEASKHIYPDYTSWHSLVSGNDADVHL